MASTLPPDGSAMFQFMSNSVRSITASRLRWPRLLPNASAAGAIHVPVAWTGRVMPLIVSSPATLAVLREQGLEQGFAERGFAWEARGLSR